MPSIQAMRSFLRELRVQAPPTDVASKFPFTIPCIRSLGRLDLAQPVTFLVGENGSGKSTLIEAIAIKSGFNPEGGSKNFRTALRPSESDLHKHLVLSRGTRRERGGFFLRAETMFNVSTEAEEYAEYGWEHLHAKSHGEAFLWVAQNRFRGDGLYILDEPEAALSPQRQLVLLRIMHDLVRQGSQFVISTHSPILMAFPSAILYLLDSGGIRRIEYKQTEHYLVTRAFLQDPKKMLDEVFADLDDEKRDPRAPTNS